MNTITIHSSAVLGPIKPMNAVNNGPVVAGKDQTRGNLPTYRALEIPFARTHDAAFFNGYGGEHTVDISAVFPDFDADPLDPASYDFDLTDMYMEQILSAGTEPYFRLGQKIEHLPKKYYIFPPRDFKKWAVVCEHIIRHLNEGWAKGHRYGIRYWEIWNEPDLCDWMGLPVSEKKTWTGTAEQFYDLFETAAKHLKKCFPKLKIGGPACCGKWEWETAFVEEMGRRKVPMDFFSWHVYAKEPKWIAWNARRIRELLDANGYAKTESHCNEWNYVRNWTDGFVYTVKNIIGVKGAAYAAAAMCDAQNAPVDMLMYYDARPTGFNGIWDYYAYEPLKGWFVFDAFRRLRRLGNHVRTELSPDLAKGEEVYAAAARCKSGAHKAAMVARFVEEDEKARPRNVALKLAKGAWKKPRVFILDAKRNLEPAPFRIEGDALVLRLAPHSVALVEW